MEVKLIENFDISNYLVCETASNTIEYADFLYSKLFKSSHFSSINNDTKQFYASISTNHNTDSVYVIFQNSKMNETELLVQYKVSIVDVTGEKQHTKDFAFKYTENYQLSHNLFMSRNDILESANRLLHNGTLKVFVEALVLEESAVPQTEKTIGDDLQSLLESGKSSDVVFVVKGNELKAHKAILSARSPVFAAMFEHDMQEKLKNQVDITDIDADVFEEMLRYIYTDQVAKLKKYAVDLLMAADKYQMESLKSRCERALFSAITTETFSQILVLSYLYNLPYLQKKCCNFFYYKRQKIMAIKNWDKAIADKPMLLLMLLKLFVVVSFTLKNQYKMEVKLIENFDISDYSVRETASATLECADFQNNESYEYSSFSPINNDTIQFYAIIYPNANPDSVSVFFQIVKMNETELLVQYKVSIVDVNGKKQHTKDFAFKYIKELQHSRHLYMSRNDILNSANTLLHNGTLKVFVEVMTADKYQLESLKSRCEKALFNEITTESFSQILIFSNMYNLPDLQEKCCDFFAIKHKEIMAIKDWDKAIADKPELLLMLLKLFN